MPVSEKPALQNEDTEVKTACHIPMPQPYSGMKVMQRSTAPKNSMENVPIKIYFKSPFTPAILSPPADCMASFLSERVTSFFIYNIKRDSMVMKPSPPI